MNFDRKQNPKQQTVAARSEKSLAGKKRKRVYQIVTAILTVFVAQFVWQFSFIQRENQRIAEDSLNSAKIEAASVESPSGEETVAPPPESTAKKAEPAKTARTSVPVKYSPPENKSPQSEMKDKMKRESLSARRRRAEKLLTGF